MRKRDENDQCGPYDLVARLAEDRHDRGGDGKTDACADAGPSKTRLPFLRRQRDHACTDGSAYADAGTHT